MKLRLGAMLVVLALSACVGTTGGEIVDFPAAAAGPADAVEGTPLVFTNDLGWRVTLTKAIVHVGAVYLGQAMPVSGAQNTNCISPGTYVAQVTSGLDIDLLSPAPQFFPTKGHGTTLDSRVAQVWLTGGDVSRVTDPTPILTIEGTAARGGDVRPFTGKITISDNRQVQGGELAGADLICKQRIVWPIPIALTVSHAGGMLLRIDPRFLFLNVKFEELKQFSSGYGFSDDPSATDPASPLYYSQPSINLYRNLRAAGALYTFTWDSNL